jgi:hypothetical protein
MGVISFIVDQDIIKKPSNPWDFGRSSPDLPPKGTGPPETPEYHLDYSTSQITVSDK